MRIGPFEVLKELGRGGTSIVYLVRGPDGRELALKLLVAAPPDALARFERERRLNAELNELEGFVPIIEWGAAAQGPWLSMPYLPGGTLRDRLARGPLAVAETIAMGRRLARALAGAHALGVVHRDLKPENVLYDAEGLPAIADFGLAKHVSSASQAALSRSGTMRGTAGYMSPEQIADAKSAGPAADVFALGAILYECLAGRAAFPGDTVLEVLVRVEAGRSPPLRAVRAGTPAWLAKAIERALARDPSARPADALALAKLLDAGDAGGGPRRRELVGAASVLGLTAIVLGALALARPSARSSDPPGGSPPRTPSAGDAASLASARAAKASGDAVLARARRAMLTAKPDTKTIGADLRRVVAQDLRSSLGWALLAEVAYLEHDYEEAARAAERSLALDANEAIALTALAGARFALEDRDRAVEAIDRAIALAPDYAVAWTRRGTMRERLGNRDGSLADFVKALELGPDEPFAWLRVGVARMNMDDGTGALADFDRAIALDSTIAFAYIQRAILRRTWKQHDAVIEDTTRAIQLDHTNSLVYVMRAGSHDARGDLRAAADDYASAAELEPDKAVYWHNLAGSCLRIRDFKAAITAATKALALDDRAVTRDLRSEAYEALGDRARALSDLEAAEEKDPLPARRADIERLRATR